MKKLLFAGAGALALTMGAAAAHAQDVSTGYVGVNYTDVNVSGGGATLVDVNGTVAFKVSDDWQLQLDGQIGSLNPDGPGGSETIWSPTAHLFYDKGNFKGGVFLGYEDLGSTFGVDATATGYGLEGRWSAGDNVTLGLLAGWGTINLDGAPDIDLTAYKGDLSIFSSDHLRWDVSVSQTKMDWGPFSGDSTIWGVGGEWQMEDKPISFIFGYNSASSDMPSGDANTWTIGVRHTIGGSLKDRDRTSSPFLGLPFDFGGIGGIIAGLGSVTNDVLDCFEPESESSFSCPSNDTAIENWLDGFSDSALCDIFDEACDD